MGITAIELGGVGPVSHCGMLMADLGADVITVERPGGRGPASGYTSTTGRGRRSIVVDLKSARGREVVLRLVARSDIAIEGFRPGVAERLGIGPEECWAHRRDLVYGRATGWGQTGPLAQVPGHDINYSALTGALHAVGTADSGPVPALNLLADYAGGSLFLTVGVLSALLRARSTGTGQVVDAAMVDGVASLMALQHGLLGDGRWSVQRASNELDGAAPYYRAYRCADGSWLAVGAIEDAFYEAFVSGLGLSGEPLVTGERTDPASWPAAARIIEERIARHRRAHWLDMFSGTSACVTPVNDVREAQGDPHLRQRGTFVERDGLTAPAPAPRFSEFGPQRPATDSAAGTDTLALLDATGWSPDDIRSLLDDGSVMSAEENP